MGESLGSMLAEAAFNTLIGMGTVFIVLILISFIIWLFKFIGIAEQKKSQKKSAGSPGTTSQEAESPAEETGNLSDDRELVAVIAAAIAAYEGTDPDGIIVRSVRRIRKNTGSVRG